MAGNSQKSDSKRLPSALIGSWGIYQITLGLYFVFALPSFLPEDLRAIGTTREAVRGVAPGMEQWLNLVFAVLGGQIAALGVLLVATAFRVLQGHCLGAVEVAVGIATGLLSVALMSAVNFAQGSDFRWLLIAPVIPWLAVIKVVFWQARNRTS